MPYLPHTTRSKRRIVGARLAAPLLALLAMTACSSSGNGGNSNSANATGSSAASGSTSSAGGSSAPATGSDDPVGQAKADLAKYSAPTTTYPSVKPIPGGISSLKGKTVWYVPIGSAVPILNAFGVGVQQALTNVGMKFHVCDGKFLPTTIASCLDQAATQGADAVITGYIDYQLVPTSFDKLVAKKIPVLIAGEQPSGGKTDSSKLAFYDTSNSVNLLQKLSADAVIADSDGKAKVLFIGVTDSPQTKGAATYSKQYFADNCPDCTFTEIDYNTASLNKVPSQVSSALIANPDTTYVMPSLDAAAPGAISGIQTAGYSNKVKLASTNGALDSLQRVKAGQVQFVDIGFSPIYTGWQFTDGMLRMLKGGVPDTSNLGVIRVFDKDTVANLTLTPHAYATNAWYGPDTYKNTFLTAWGNA